MRIILEPEEIQEIKRNLEGFKDLTTIDHIEINDLEIVFYHRVGDGNHVSVMHRIVRNRRSEN